MGALRTTLQLGQTLANVPEPREGFEARLWARLQTAEHRPAGRSWQRAGLGWGLALLALIAAGIWHFRPAAAPPVLVRRVATVRTRVVRAAAANQLDRTEMLLVALAHAPASNSATVVDLSLEQDWARELVDTDRLVQQSATWNGQARLAGLLADLEPVLLQIAHAPAAVTRHQWQSLQDRINASGLLLRVRIASRNLAAPPNFEDGTL